LRSFVVELPYPSAALSQNARGAWQRHHSKQQRAKMDGYLAALEAMHKCSYEPPSGRHVHWAVTVRCYPPDHRRRDVHNTFAALKHYVDGIAEAMKVDDSRFTMWTIEPFGDVVRHGSVVLMFEEMRGDERR
jgi:hypothetical protein